MQHVQQVEKPVIDLELVAMVLHVLEANVSTKPNLVQVINAELHGKAHVSPTITVSMVSVMLLVHLKVMYVALLSDPKNSVVQV